MTGDRFLEYTEDTEKYAKVLPNILSRRGFIKNACACLVLGGVRIAGGAPELAVARGSTPVIGRRPATLTPPSPTDTLTPSVTPDVGKLSIPQWVEIMRKPGLFTELQGENTRKINQRIKHKT